MGSRKIATLLVESQTTYIKFDHKKFPLWNISEHLDYLKEFTFSDVIICSSSAEHLFDCNLTEFINYSAGIGWSQIHMVPQLFEFGFSKIFFGGSYQQTPNNKQRKFLDKLLKIYGSSSFGFNLHISSEKKHLADQDFLGCFSEITVIDEDSQVSLNIQKGECLAKKINEFARPNDNELNLVAPKLIWKEVISKTHLKVNYVNYCEHGIENLL